MRYAIYFSPGPTDALSQGAAKWLGRDAFTGDARAHPAMETIQLADITRSPRRYGFHATLKAPFHLSSRTTEAELLAAFDEFAETEPAFTVPAMKVGNIDGFLAIIPSSPSRALNAFADRVVMAFDKFRAPLTAADIERRTPHMLSPIEAVNLHDWGYPYVFESFYFHMTLTDRLNPSDQPAVLAAAQDYFAPLLPQPFPIDSLALFVEPQPGAPFTVLRHVKLTATSRKGP
jgi:putative phosphonate metabolism protein